MVGTKIMYKRYKFLNKTAHFIQNPQIPYRDLPIQIVNLIQSTNKGEKR
jgi:hypothetical protein